MPLCSQVLVQSVRDVQPWLLALQRRKMSAAPVDPQYTTWSAVPAMRDGARRLTSENGASSDYAHRVIGKLAPRVVQLGASECCRFVDAARERAAHRIDSGHSSLRWRARSSAPDPSDGI